MDRQSRRKNTHIVSICLGPRGTKGQTPLFVDPVVFDGTQVASLKSESAIERQRRIHTFPVALVAAEVCLKLAVNHSAPAP